MAYKRKSYIGVYEDTHEEFVCDTAADLAALPVDAPQGSAAFVIEDSTTWMINSRGEWIETDMGSSGGGDVTLTSIDITDNGTYRAPSGTAYNKVTVAVEDTPDPDPADGKTHIWAHIDEDTPEDRREFTLAWNQSVSNGVEIDWGDSGTIVETLAGPVVSFSGDVSVNSIAIGIKPAQAGSGDPSPDNVRPISGWTAAKVYRLGKNLMTEPYDVTKPTNYPSGWNGTAVDADGVVTQTDYNIARGGFGGVVVYGTPAGTYTFSFDADYSGVSTANCAISILARYRGASEHISLYNNTNVSAARPSVTVTLDSYAEWVALRVTGGRASDSDSVFRYSHIQLEPGSAATEYEPYYGETLDVAFSSEAGTVYGGTLDLTAGTLTVDRATVVLRSNGLNWHASTSYPGGFYADRTAFANVYGIPVVKAQTPFACSHAKSVASVSDYAYGTCFMDYSVNIRIMAEGSTAQDWKDYIQAQYDAGTPVQVCLTLVDPVIYQLTPVQIDALLCDNNIWANTGDTTVEIEYPDIQTVAGTGDVSLTHQYDGGGEYEITMDAIEGNISFTGTSGTAGTAIYGSKANSRCYNRQRITRISVGENAAVGSYMAHYCYGLSRIGFPSTLTSIGAHAFEECFSLPSVEIPDGVTSIGEYAFSYCHSLESADIPDSVVSIGAYAFRNCYGLREIDFPSGLTSISDYTYQGCYNITSIDIPNTVTSIGNGAFHSCYGLTSVRIPAAVRSIGDSAFLNCYGVSEYHIGATTPPTLASTNAFTGMASDCVIYVPRSTNQTVLNAYKAATNWVTYASRMQEEAE